MKKILAVLLCTLTTGAFAQDDNKYYAELGYGVLQWKESGYTQNWGAGILKLGMNIDKNFAVEMMAATNLVNDSFRYSGYTVTTKLDGAYGVYGKAKLDVSQDLQIFARLGYTNAQISAQVLSYNFSSSGSDVSYGVGAQYNINKTLYGQIDYMSYYNKGGVSVGGPSVSLGVKF